MIWPPLLIVWLCWGLSYPFMAWTLEAVDLITARLLANAGAGILLLLLCLRTPGHRILPHRGEWRGVLALSLLIMVVFPFALIAGVMLVGPGQAAILNYTMPLWASLLAVPVLGERLDRRTMVALGLGLAAVLLVLAGTTGPEGTSGLGVALGLAAGATFGAGTVLSKKLRFRSPVLLITAWQLLQHVPQHLGLGHQRREAGRQVRPRRVVEDATLTGATARAPSRPRSVPFRRAPPRCAAPRSTSPCARSGRRIRP